MRKKKSGRRRATALLRGAEDGHASLQPLQLQMQGMPQARKIRNLKDGFASLALAFGIHPYTSTILDAASLKLVV
ncbi:hypothetical protein CPAR01_07556 [Colletotrichum paranaense]|uniref:Uncharacterized protein n=1 Tax=Colletotrichum paranaense TaxID=1914294 RepID=A0ABQ9SR74_9PEZI|nr:uncharacterized protein CPAR01_07556 [Colletotrichum paranaense]KAK1541567.1 hypothetical protein CPAR01_07556 [Colletotrichum paranaense]